jgi:hypothetical protein
MTPASVRIAVHDSEVQLQAPILLLHARQLQSIQYPVGAAMVTCATWTVAFQPLHHLHGLVVPLQSHFVATL